MIFKVFIALLLLASNCYALTITQGSTQRELTDKDLQSQLHLATVEIEDPLYKKHKRYAGYWLSDILNLAGIQPDPNTTWTFIASDGYKAPISVSDVIRSKARGFVAIKDLDAPDGWEKFQHGKEWITPAPSYLVWQTSADTPKDITLPWPYEMVEISIRTTDEAQQKLFPDSGEKSASVMRGFKVFQQNCIACHSINLEGGVLGPELNVPKNILEYEDRAFLKSFIEDPNSYRARSKMPVFKGALPDQSIDDVLDYLAWMGKNKIQ